MPRTSRMLVSDEKAVYHVMSRTALDGFPLEDVEKELMLGLLKRFAAFYFTEILGFCLMGNHFHLLVKMLPDSRYTDSDIKKRLELFYGDERKKRQVNYACKKVFDDVVDRDFFSERLGLIIQQSQTQCFAWALIRSIVR